VSQESIEDEDDIFIQNLNTVFFLLFGIFSVIASMILFVHSATVAFYSQYLPIDFLIKPVSAALVFAMGFGSMYIFRKRRESAKRKKTAFFLR